MIIGAATEVQRTSGHPPLDLDGFEGSYTDVFTGAQTRIKSTLKRHFRPWGYQVLQRTG